MWDSANVQCNFNLHLINLCLVQLSVLFIEVITSPLGNVCSYIRYSESDKHRRRIKVGGIIEAHESALSLILLFPLLFSSTTYGASGKPMFTACGGFTDDSHVLRNRLRGCLAIRTSKAKLTSTRKCAHPLRSGWRIRHPTTMHDYGRAYPKTWAGRAQNTADKPIRGFPK